MHEPQHHYLVWLYCIAFFPVTSYTNGKIIRCNPYDLWDSPCSPFVLAAKFITNLADHLRYVLNIFLHAGDIINGRLQIPW